MTLAANTTYWIVFKSLDTYPNSFFRVAQSNSNDEDASGATGWSIGNQSMARFYTAKKSENWVAVADSHPLAVGVYATPN